MTEKRIGFAVVNTATEEIYKRASALPIRVAPVGKPNSRLATFTEVGQAVLGYLCAELWIVESPNRYYTRGTPSTTLVGNKCTIDPNWVFDSVVGAVRHRKGIIKETAQAIIYAAYPVEKQLTHLMNEGPALATMKTKVTSVRDHSDVLEAEVDAIAAGVGTDEAKADSISQYAMHDWPVI